MSRTGIASVGAAAVGAGAGASCTMCRSENNSRVVTAEVSVSRVSVSRRVVAGPVASGPPVHCSPSGRMTLRALQATSLRWDRVLSPCQMSGLRVTASARRIAILGASGTFTTGC